jgi:nicotinamide mononucleotide transporter
MSLLEIGANVFNASAVFLAARNSVHTWWLGIIGCVLMGVMFLGDRLYANATLQVFFIATGVLGWRAWSSRTPRPIRHVSKEALAVGLVVASIVTAGHALALDRWTNAAAPLPDSAVMAFSVLGQVWLMGRRLETWWCWIIVDAIAVPLYVSRELYVTAGLYAVFFVTAWLGWLHWRRELTQRLRDGGLRAYRPPP